MQRLSRYPFIVVRIGCTVCHRAGQYRLARLAERYGAETTLEAILMDLTRDCSYRHMPHRPTRLKNLGDCQAYFPDLHAPTRPPDLPPGMRRPVLVHDNHKPKDDPPFRRRQNVRPTK